MQDVGNLPIAAQSPRRKTWPWAAGSVLAMALVLAATLIGRQIAASHRAAGYLVAAPARPMLSVLGSTPADRAIRLAALDPQSGDLLALTSAPLNDCPPTVACVSSPVPDTLAVYDGATGRQIASRALVPNDPLTHAALLLVDGKRGVAYAVVPPGELTGAVLYRLSPTTAQPMGEVELSSTDFATILGGSLVPLQGYLALAANNQLLLLDPATGAILSRQQLAPAGGSLSVDGPVVDPAGTRIALVQRDASGASLRTFAAAGSNRLEPLATHPLPSGARLGDYDAYTGTFALIDASGDVSTLSLDDVTNTGNAPTPVRGVASARAAAWDGANNRLIVAHTSDVTAYDTRTGQAVAALPISVATTDPAAPLGRGVFTAQNGGRVYLRDAAGAFVIASDTTTQGADDSETALILARAAMARFLPTPKQTPPFVAPASFPVGAGSHPRDYYIHFGDRGWQAYPNGSIGSAVSATTRGNAAYQVTFTIAWYQLFQHTHTWTCLVMRDGSVRLTAEAGDALP